MGKLLIPLVLFCAIFCACSSNDVSWQNPAFEGDRQSAREIFFSDSLNASWKSRTYPVPNAVYTPAPRGYKPVYVSSYARHGSRQMIGGRQTESLLRVLDTASRSGWLTPLGEEVFEKVKRINDDPRIDNAELTPAGVEQHRGIAERMYLNYKNVFSHKNTPVRFYSTSSQRTIMSMISANSRLLELNPHINSTRSASQSLTFLIRVPEFPLDRVPMSNTRMFLDEYFDARPLLSRLFTEDMTALKDTSRFVNNLYSCAAVTCGLDLEDVDFIWDLFTYEELYMIFQASNYNWYVLYSNSPYMGDYNLKSMSPLLRDFIDRADTALAEDVPGADLRFGHDSYLTCFLALIGLNGFVPKEEDPAKVVDIFQAFVLAPMAGNVQMVFYRNRAGDVIVKLLLNEKEAFVPIETDIYPYYHWDELREYFESCIDPDYVEQDASLVEW